MAKLTQNQMMAAFINEVSKACAFGNYMSKAGEYLEGAGINTDDHWEVHNKYTDVYLRKIAEIMDVNRVSDLISDEWFWAEWTSSELCFMYVYGYTAHIREERESERWNSKQRDEEIACLNKAKKLMEDR